MDPASLFSFHLAVWVYVWADFTPDCSGWLQVVQLVGSELWLKFEKIAARVFRFLFSKSVANTLPLKNRHCKAGVPAQFHTHMITVGTKLLLSCCFPLQCISIYAMCVNWVLGRGWKSSSFIKHLRQTCLTSPKRSRGPKAGTRSKGFLFFRDQRDKSRQAAGLFTLTCLLVLF